MPDYSVIDRVAGWGQANTGISDYAQGVAARERTATGANAVANSAQKRLSPYLSSFVDCASEFFCINIWEVIAQKSVKSAARWLIGRVFRKSSSLNGDLLKGERISAPKFCIKVG